MNSFTLIVRSLRHYWRTHLGVLLGTALGAVVLTGSLLVGDSVKATLVRQAKLRVGQVDSVMLGGDHFFRDALAGELGPRTAPVLLLRGSVSRVEGAARINQAQILGVDERFWQLGPEASVGSAAQPPQNQNTPQNAPQNIPQNPPAWINARMAAQLGVTQGDTLIVRVEKPGLFSKDAPFSGEENQVLALRVRVMSTVSEDSFGNFGLQANQVPQYSIFVPLSLLQEKLGIKGQANLLLAGNQSAAELESAVRAHWQLADAGLELRVLDKAGAHELRTSRVFLETQIIEAVPRGVDALTYLVNEIRAGDKAVPYSMVTGLDAPGSGFLPAALANDEIVLNQWLADDLGVSSGGRVQLKFFVSGERRQLVERTREFKVLAVLPMAEPQLDGSWMPNFPGLSDKENCRDWEPGFDIDVAKFRPKDEAYWNTYRGTPKAFVNIAAAQQMWANRWGALTAIRYPGTISESAVASQTLQKLTPQGAGLSFLPLREQALAATKAPVDFGELFVSFSFFLIAAAAVLTGLLHVFSIEQRQAQAGLLMALGWRAGQVQLLFAGEGIVVAMAGSVLGTIGALLYTQGILTALGSLWRDAVGGAHFVFAPSVGTLLVGAVSAVLIAVLAMWLASRRQFRHSARELLSGPLAIQSEVGVSGSAGGVPKSLALKRPVIAAGVCLASALALVIWAAGAESFFGAGSLLLLACIFSAQAWLRIVARSASAGLETIAELGTRNAARRRGRSLSTLAVLASGVFIVVAVDAFRQRPQAATLERATGTGGFTLLGESALPIYDDLNTQQGREAYALDAKLMEEVRVVPLRVRDGDDASCLNLNRALQPRLLGVKPEELASRKAFRAEWLPKQAAGWSGLDEKRADGSLVGVVDQATLQWALQKKLGDTIDYIDERGAPFKVRIQGVLKGSVLQGNIVIAEDSFVTKFPSQGGYRFFLIDSPLAKSEPLGAHLSRALQDRGFEATPAARRVAEFQAVENSYLSIFQGLGGLGLLLGSAGLAIVVARNVLERRAEFALLEALGFGPAQLRALVFAEHRWLIVAGLLTGTGSALVAVWPGLSRRAEGFPLLEMGLLIGALFLGCLFWAWLATRLVLRGSQLAALRSE